MKVASEQDLANKYEVVVDLAGSNHSNLETPFLESFRYIKPSGLCVLVGTYFHPVPFVPFNAVLQEFNIVPSFAYDSSDASDLAGVLNALDDFNFSVFNTDVPFKDTINEGYFKAELDKDAFTRMVITFGH